MDNNPKIKNKSNNNTSVSSPSSANGNGSSPKIDGLAVAQKGLEIAEEIKNAKERIDEAVENGESEEQAVLDEGKNQVKNGISDATDYGIKKAREKIEKEFAKKQAQKKAAEEATKQVGKKAGEEVAKKGVESGTKAAGVTAEKAAEAGAAEGVAAGTTTAGVTAAGTTATGTTAAGTTAAGATAGGATASTPVGWIVLIVIAAIILTIIMAVIIIFIIMGLFVLISLFSSIIGTSFSTNDNYYACNDGIIVYDDTKSMELSVDAYLINQLHNIFTKIEYDESGNIIGYKPLYFNEDIYKATAIAKRSSILASTDTDCSIYDPTYDIGEEIESQMPRSELLDATIETKDRIISQNNSGIINASLDYFCPQEKDDDDYYTLYQKDQLIPKNWINNNNLMPNEWKQGNCISYYGMSLYGALYLSQEKGYDYGEIIKYYFDDTSIGESIPFTSPVTGDIKNTAGASNKIDVPIGQFLSSRGSSLNELNNYIESSVNQAGRGTREGVVAAAVSLINFLYDKFDAKLPYYWGGKYAGKGIPSFFGEYDPQGHISRNGYVFHIKSFDCSGFVQWAIINGGFSNPGTGTGYFAQAYGANSCNISLVNCVGVPGDLINSPNGHVQLIIAVDNNGGNYVVAESTTTGVVIQYRGMHKNNSSGTYKILHMDRFYGQ